MNLGRYDNYPINTLRGFLFARADLERIAAGAELSLPEFASVSQVQRIIESPETPDQVSANLYHFMQWVEERMLGWSHQPCVYCWN